MCEFVCVDTRVLSLLTLALFYFFFLLRQVPSPNLEPTDWLHMIGLLALVIETIKLNLSFALCLTKWPVS